MRPRFPDPQKPPTPFTAPAQSPSTLYGSRSAGGWWCTHQVQDVCELAPDTGRTRLHRLPELRTRVRTLCTGFGVHQERHKEPFWCTLLAPEAFIVPATVCTALHWIDVTLSLSPRTEISVTPVNHMESPYSHQRRHETAEIVQPWNVRKLVLKVTNPGSASSVHCSILSLSYILSD